MRAAARHQRWAGPPPLLVLATVVGFLASWGLSAAGDPAPDPAPDRAELAAVESTPAPTAKGPRPAAEQGQLIKRTHTIGVVTFDQYRKLSPTQALSDARAITERPQVDIVGWQEAYTSAPVFEALRKQGWDARQFPRRGQELAVSWRRSDFELVSSARATGGARHGRGHRPLPVPGPLRRAGDPAAPRHRPADECHQHRTCRRRSRTSTAPAGGPRPRTRSRRSTSSTG